ncbi:hypothetical protein B0H14DRAFT_2604596 [Mycena olivaceomarginata]|nr:hypothetical protein B0H14DRAFT_2604596 [Mycena olivaceomarginata]
MVPFFLGNVDAELCSCTKLARITNYLFVVQELLIGCTLILRVCAMYGFNRRVVVSLSIVTITTLELGARKDNNPYIFEWVGIVCPDTRLETSVPGCHNVTPHDHTAALPPRAVVAALASGTHLLQQFMCIQVTKLTQKSAVELASKGGTRGGKGQQRGAAVGAAVGAANICGGGTFPFWVGSWGRQCNYVTKGGSVTMCDNGRQWAARAAVCIKFMV